MTAQRSIALLAAEAKLREGETPASLPGALAQAPTFAITRDAFLLKLPSGLRFHYQQGKGVTVSRPDSVSDRDVALFLNGSVYGAIAWLNGLVPLHASGIVHEGAVHAFTGHSGAGKSTLAAALSAHDLPLIADDVLVLDLSDPAAVMCLPGHKQLKLWGDAVRLTGLEAGGRVRDTLDKFYIAPAAGFLAEPMPLSHLYFLEENARTGSAFAPVRGSQRLMMLRGALYRPLFCSAVVEQRDLFGLLSRIASQVTIARFDRPKRKDLFAEGVDAVAAAIKGA